MERNLFKKLIISDIPNIYLSVSKIALIFSSFFFVFFLLAFFFGIKIATAIFLVIIYLPIFLGQKRKYRKIKNHIGNGMLILGSIIVLFLFLNLYLKIFSGINDGFLKIIKITENYLSQIIFKLVFLSIFFLLISYFSKFIQNRFKSEKISSIISAGTILFLVFSFFLIINKNFLSNEYYFYPEYLKYIFGVSILYLHSNYLIKVIKDNLIKRKILI